jgi:transketolase
MALEVRKKMLQMSLDSDSASHLGGGLSLVEILVALYGEVMNFDHENPFWELRDRFILSKGHGVLAFFAILNHVGLITNSDLKTFMRNGSLLIAHPILDLAHGIESSNGSLGQGLSFGAGMAKAGKLKNEIYSVYVLMGDGECNEGSVWEAAQLSSDLQLNNLTVIIDANGLQSDDKVGNGYNFENLQKKFESFGWESILVDGHDVSALVDCLKRPRSQYLPLCIVAKTTKGKGISFMENDNIWHHARLTKTNYDLALAEINLKLNG